jgi:4-hydroxy-tetrahydrodipicolinate reductase
MIRVSVIGSNGRMGSTVVQTVLAEDGLELSKKIDADDDINAVTSENTDIAVEFSSPAVSFENVEKLVSNGVSVVVGTTGWDEQKQQALNAILKQYNEANNSHVKVIIVPNFSISAILLKQFSVTAAKYFESVEILEYHHPDKLDAPSGTAIATANAISEARKSAGITTEIPDATISDEPGSRGGKISGIPVHAVRLRGLTAHEEVLFGGPGEMLTIKQDSFDRISFMNGVVIAVKNIHTLPNDLTFGLDDLII